jgi:hypothetical protein
MITFIRKIFARFFTKYLPMARFARFPAGLQAAGPRRWMPHKCGPWSPDPDPWVSNHALTSWCSPDTAVRNGRRGSRGLIYDLPVAARPARIQGVAGFGGRSGADVISQAEKFAKLDFICG